MKALLEFLAQPAGRHEPPRSSRRFPPRSRTLAIFIAIALIFGVGGGAASTAFLADTASSTASPAHVGTTIRFSAAAQAELRKLESTPTGRAALLRAFQDSFGRKADVAANPGDGGSEIRLDATCAPSISCGLSDSGGWHFWIITSYAAAESADLWAMQPYCWAALASATGRSSRRRSMPRRGVRPLGVGQQLASHDEPRRVAIGLLVGHTGRALLSDEHRQVGQGLLRRSQNGLAAEPRAALRCQPRS